MATTEAFAGTEAVSTVNEWSLPRDLAYSAGSPQTDDGVYQLWLDLSDMVTTDDLRIRVYEKVQAADTQRVFYEARVVGPQAPAQWLSIPFTLLHGWDITLLTITGTITVSWSIRKVA